MSVRHHPADDLLLNYATGRLEAPIVLIVATHLTQCQHCKLRVGCLDALGGALLEDMPPATMAANALSRALATFDHKATQNNLFQSTVPVSLGLLTSGDFDAFRWRRSLPGLRYVKLYHDPDITVILTRAEAGQELGLHRHDGLEYTQTLLGGYTDQTGQYGRGDFQTSSIELMHNPMADLSGECITLSVTFSKIAFATK